MARSGGSRLGYGQRHVLSTHFTHYSPTLTRFRMRFDWATRFFFEHDMTLFLCTLSIRHLRSPFPRRLDMVYFRVAYPSCRYWLTRMYICRTPNSHLWESFYVGFYPLILQTDTFYQAMRLRGYFDNLPFKFRVLNVLRYFIVTHGKLVVIILIMWLAITFLFVCRP